MTVIIEKNSFLNTATIRNFLWPKTNYHYEFLYIFFTSSECYTNCMDNNYALSNQEYIIIERATRITHMGHLPRTSHCTVECRWGDKVKKQ